MEKIAVGGGLPEGIVDLAAPPQNNLKSVAKAKGCDVADLVVVHSGTRAPRELIAAVRAAGARIQLIGDGDVAGVIATARPDTGVDMYMGTGGAPEGVLAAAALQCIGGQMQGRLVFREEAERAGAAHGHHRFQAYLPMDELAHGDVMFAATGVTDGSMVRGVRRFPGGATTHSIIMRSKTGTVRVIEAQHNFGRKTWGDFGGE